MAAAPPADQEDAKRMILFDLVKSGKLTPEEAMAHAQRLGITSSPPERSTSLSKSTRLHNFSVYKWTERTLSVGRESRTVQRIILQFDFQSRTLSSIQHGMRTKKVEFTDITGYQSEDGLRLSIQFESQSNYELDANTPEEKNEMVHLLAAVLQRRNNASSGSKAFPTPFPTDKDEEQNPPGPGLAPVEEGGEGEDRELQKILTSTGEPTARHSPPKEQKVPSLIKEGLVEKKRHMASWTRKWIKVYEGKLLYFRPEDTTDADPSTIPLNPGSVTIGKADTNKFIITLTDRNRVLQFRVIAEARKAQTERDKWYQALELACKETKESELCISPGPDRAPLQVKSKTATELFQLVKQEIASLDKFVSSTLSSTGSSQVDMTVVAIASIVAALEEHYREQRAEPETPITESPFTESPKLQGANSALSSTPLQAPPSGGSAAARNDYQSMPTGTQPPSDDALEGPGAMNRAAGDPPLSPEGSLAPLDQDATSAERVLSPANEGDITRVSLRDPTQSPDDDSTTSAESESTQAPVGEKSTTSESLPIPTHEKDTPGQGLCDPMVLVEDTATGERYQASAAGHTSEERYHTSPGEVAGHLSSTDEDKSYDTLADKGNTSAGKETASRESVQTPESNEHVSYQYQGPERDDAIQGVSAPSPVNDEKTTLGSSFEVPEQDTGARESQHFPASHTEGEVTADRKSQASPMNEATRNDGYSPPVAGQEAISDESSLRPPDEGESLVLDRNVRDTSGEEVTSEEKFTSQVDELTHPADRDRSSPTEGKVDVPVNGLEESVSKETTPLAGTAVLDKAREDDKENEKEEKGEKEEEKEEEKEQAKKDDKEKEGGEKEKEKGEKEEVEKGENKDEAREEGTTTVSGEGPQDTGEVSSHPAGRVATEKELVKNLELEMGLERFESPGTSVQDLLTHLGVGDEGSVQEPQQQQQHEPHAKSHPMGVTSSSHTLPASFVPHPPAPPPPPPPMPPSLNSPTPQRKTKQFHWNLLRTDLLVSSGWMEWSSKDAPRSLDLQTLEELFKAASHEDRSQLTAKKSITQSLLDHVRSRNIEIFLSRFPLSVTNLHETLNVQLNCISAASALELDHVVALKRLQPSQEETKLCKSYTGDRYQLQPADNFLFELCEVPMLSTRLDLLYTIREFPANLDSFEPILDLAWRACNELKNSGMFAEVLQYVLAIGNHLNAGSRLGGAYGFKLETLPKLVALRGKEKVTLLHYLIQELKRQRPELLDFPQQMESVAKASEISITSILAELEVMHKDLDKIERTMKEVIGHLDMDTSDTAEFQRDVKIFLSQYRNRLKSLNKKGEEMEALYIKLLVQFGEPNSTPSEDFFGTWISTFIGQFKRIRRELFPPDHGEQSRPKVRQYGGIRVLPTVEARPPEKPARMNKIQSLRVQPTKPPPKEGYLEKKGRDGRWNKRYFELERGLLHYYKGKGQRHCDTINLYGRLPARISPDDARVIVIETEQRTLNIKAEGPKLAQEWLSAFNLHSQGQGQK